MFRGWVPSAPDALWITMSIWLFDDTQTNKIFCVTQALEKKKLTTSIYTHPVCPEEHFVRHSLIILENTQDQAAVLQLILMFQRQKYAIVFAADQYSKNSSLFN